MNVLIKQIELIERIDQLIRMQATGNPATLAKRLGVSRTTLYRTMNTMQALNAPVVYNVSLQSYVYQKTVGFAFGFYQKGVRDAIVSKIAR